MKGMGAKKGFTLIEVMVVLSILAIIAILAYNFFGGTMREASRTQAAAKIADDMRVIDDAWNKHYLDNTSEPATIAELVGDGIIKAVPMPPSGGIDGAATSTEAYQIFLGASGGFDMSGVNGTDDTVAYLEGVSQDVCEEINNRYTDETDAPVKADVDAVAGVNKNIVCYQITAADGVNIDAGEYVVFKLLMVDSE